MAYAGTPLNITHYSYSCLTAVSPRCKASQNIPGLNLLWLKLSRQNPGKECRKTSQLGTPLLQLLHLGTSSVKYPGSPLHRPSPTLALVVPCAHFSSSHPTRTVPVLSALGPPARTCYSSSQLTKVSRHGMTIHKAIPSSFGEAAILPNS